MGDFLVSDERYKNDIGVEVQYMTTEVVKEYLPKVTEEEIKSIIQEGTEDGEVQIVEQQIVGLQHGHQAGIRGGKKPCRE